MTAEAYSVWLMPAPAWAQEFKAIVDDLAGRFGSPRFVPHLTLIGGQPFDRADLERRLGPLLAEAKPIETPVLDVVTGEAFFRSFYALFAAKDPLLALRQRVHCGILGTAPEFMPHVSLLYGPVEATAKEAAAGEVRARLAGRNVRFERVEIVRSGDDVPVEAWETIAGIDL